MSKTLSLESKTIYQVSLILLIIINVVFFSLSLIRGLNLFKQPPSEPSANLTQQQLKNSLEIIFPSQGVN